MARSTRLSAEAQFAKTKKLETEAALNRHQAERARSDKVDRLRALRLAKEAADREVALEAKAEKARRPHRRTKKSSVAPSDVPAVPADHS